MACYRKLLFERSSTMYSKKFLDFYNKFVPVEQPIPWNNKKQQNRKCYKFWCFSEWHSFHLDCLFHLLTFWAKLICVLSSVCSIVFWFFRANARLLYESFWFFTIKLISFVYFHSFCFQWYLVFVQYSLLTAQWKPWTKGLQ